MFRRVLIGNRGEVAARILRTCRKLEIEAVVVASHADLDAAWLSDAFRVVPLGPSRSAESYLDADALIEVAVANQCSALHPGWGFLSENAVFARRCEAAGVTFVGPAPVDLTRFGDKAVARDTMKALGMPVIPGSDGPLDDVHQARALADSMGYPVLLKAVSGGGGRGMRVVNGPDELASAWSEATSEAMSAFADGRLYLEKLIIDGRHVEVQLIADGRGTCLHLGERECSVQRRHQKVLEEAPSPGLSPSERARVLPLVADIVARTGYKSAGTVEMLLDQDGRLWFMEMNTRLQVEHPVTEQTTGLDIVELQFRVAANRPLGITQADVRHQGHALELRINAEDPRQGFRPSPGRVSALSFPHGQGIRVDTHLRQGDRIPPNYDSMIAKLIVSGPSRDVVLERARAAVSATHIEGVSTNLDLHARLLRWQPFVSGNYHTRSLEAGLDQLLAGAS